ncbi:MAG TPA: GAF domain-containing SpoIIE family protein phosphatase [Chthoniobacteraceae bacterium]|jgi:sigma-B regulation protein RsbU (phosphoserine phosphatase)
MSVDSTTLLRQLKVYKGLVEVSALINGITNSQELLPAILDVARRVMEVEASSLFLVTPEGELELASASGGTQEMRVPTRRITVPRGRGISGWVFEHRQPLLVPDAYADPRFFRETDQQTGFTTRSILCVPLLRGGKEIGVLQMLNPIGRAAFDESDLEVFEAYGTLAATAIDKLRALEQQRAQERLAQESAFAQEIQNSFLPQTLPEHAHASFAAHYRPALNVGGDFYDVIEVSPEEIYFVIGDVSGKGMPAALLMAQALSMLRLIVRPGLSPVAVMARWNSVLAGHTIRGMFITALLGRIDVPSRQVELCSAGHCHPFRVTSAGVAGEVKFPGSPPIGMLPELPARSQTITLAPDEWLVTFTDGLIESFDPDDELLDRKGVAALLARPFTSAREVVDALNLGELKHRKHAEPHDDLTLLVFSLK